MIIFVVKYWTKRLRRGVYGVDRVNRLVPAVAID